MNAFIQILFWSFHILLIAIFGWMIETRKKEIKFYLVLFIVCTLTCIGPMFRIFNAVNDEDKQMQQERYKTNATLPEGMYYLGCEILNIQEYTVNEITYYLYDFTTVDDPNWAGYVFQYYTTEQLEMDSKYILSMDSMGTNDITDDEIAIVWARVW